MEWMWFSLASAFTFALVSVLDKLLISKHVDNAKVFIVTVGVAQICLGLIVIPISAFSGLTLSTLTIVIFSGISSGMYLVIMFQIMESQDVSRVVPVVSTYPVFVAALAFFILGEQVTIYSLACILITVFGAALVSLSPSGKNASAKSAVTAMLLLFLASILFGLSQFLAKTIADDVDMWTQYMVRGVYGGFTCFSLILLPGVLKGVTSIFQKPKSVFLIGFTEGFLVFFAILFFFLAIYAGEIYMVSTVMASRPIFVFGIGLILSLPMIKLLNEPLNGRVLAVRATGTFLTVLGVVGVSLL